MNDLVVLVPGAGVGGADLLPMAWRLQRCGYRVKIFFCITWGKPLAESTRQLYHWLSKQPDPRIHLVGHSLGGLVILRCLADYPWTRAGRIVTVGTPHTNITMAQRVLRLPVARWLVGRGVASALPLLPLPIPAGREVGAIAGTHKLGVRAFFLAVPSPNDSVISVQETQHPAIAQHTVLKVSHNGMLISRAVAEEVDAFLRNGRFKSSEHRRAEYH